MAVINFVAYVAEFAGIALGAGIVGIPAPSRSSARLRSTPSMVLTGSYTGPRAVALVLSLALFSFVVLAVAGRPIWATWSRT